MKKIIHIVLLMIFPVLAMAQASGGQIKRSTKKQVEAKPSVKNKQAPNPNTPNLSNSSKSAQIVVPLYMYIDEKTGMYGYKNEEGVVVVPPKYDTQYSGRYYFAYTEFCFLSDSRPEVGEFHEGMALVADSCGYGYINMEGKEVIPCQYKMALPFSEDLAAVEDRNTEKWGYINKRGEILEENYLESILGKQIRDIITPEINYMWPSAYINVQKSRINNKDKFDKGYYDILIKDFINETEYPGFALVDIFLPMSDINRYSWDDEYEFWKETIGGLISNREIPDLSIGIWFIDDSRLIKVSDFYHSNDPKFAENEFGDMSFHFGYDDETLDIIISLDEYKAMREGKDE